MVTVADGSKVSSKEVCPNFQWSVDGDEFQAEMRMLPLGGYNMILGVQWMKQMGPVTLDMNYLTLVVFKNNKAITLKARPKQGASLQVINGATLFQMCAKKECGFISQLSFSPSQTSTLFTTTPIHIPPLAALLDSYQFLFEEPKSLPSAREHEHDIPLKPNAAQFTIRPYRYPFVQKNEI